MSNVPLQAPPELVKPDYNIYRFTDEIYKIIRFRSTAPVLVPGEKKARKGNEAKLDAALSRARRTVLELALCNDWKYFCTFSISKMKMDRKDLEKFHSSFLQWLRDMRKKYPYVPIRFVLVPEQHQDGSWHMHGLFSDISPLLISFRELWERGVNVPFKLVKNGYLNWPDYQNKFGFCSFGLIRNGIAAGFYITKYISKSLSDSPISVGLHLYYASKGLNRATIHGDVYGICGYLDKFLTNHYDFCSTGMTSVRDGVGWDFAMQYMLVEPLDISTSSESVECEDVDIYFEVVQEVLDGF